MLRQNTNPLGLRGIAFVEFASNRPNELEDLLYAFGFSLTHVNPRVNAHYFSQNQIHCIVHRNADSAGGRFSKAHGPSIPAMGWYFEDPDQALAIALERGAKRAVFSDWDLGGKRGVPAIEGIGGSLIYFIPSGDFASQLDNFGFRPLALPRKQAGFGFHAIDHLTNNVEKGEMQKWANFYKSLFGFTEVRYFDIRGAKTGLTSYALRSPCGTFCIPINEGTEEKSQINEYLREYHGPGIQHLAFTTRDIVQSISALKKQGVQTLDMDELYYSEVFDRVPNVTEDHQVLQNLNILVDGDEQGYLLQIFTKNLIGPIFIEIIQRKNHLSFGEGNFQALFRSLERDQERRGVL